MCILQYHVCRLAFDMLDFLQYCRIKSVGILKFVIQNIMYEDVMDDVNHLWCVFSQLKLSVSSSSPIFLQYSKILLPWWQRGLKQAADFVV